jgi:hypothetical protein
VPVAMMMPLRATYDSLLPSGFSTSTVCAPVSLAVPFTTVPPFDLMRPPTPLVRRLTMPSFHVCSLPASTFTSATVMPIDSACRAWSARLAAWISALLGMQPQLRHTPPIDSRSTTSVFWPSWPSRMAAM